MNWIPLESYWSISFLKFLLITFCLIVNLFWLIFGISRSMEVVMKTQSSTSRLIWRCGGMNLFFSSSSSSRVFSWFLVWELIPWARDSFNFGLWQTGSRTLKHSSKRPVLKAERPIWTMALLKQIWLEICCLPIVCCNLAFIIKSLAMEYLLWMAWW